MLTTIPEFYKILRSIVIHSKPDPCNRLNMFAVLDRIEQLNASDAGMTMQHYQKGLFWARDWVNKGASPNNIQKEYDALIVDAVREGSQSGFTENSYTIPFDIVLVGQVKCETCPTSCNDTIEGKRANLVQKLHEVVRELGTYGQYVVTPLTGAPYTAWMSEGQAQALAPNYTSIVANGKMLAASFSDSVVPFYQPTWRNIARAQGSLVGIGEKTSLIDNVVAMATSVTVRFCNPSPALNYKYDTPSIEQVAVVRCENC